MGVLTSGFRAKVWKKAATAMEAPAAGKVRIDCQGKGKLVSVVTSKQGTSGMEGRSSLFTAGQAKRILFSPAERATSIPTQDSRLAFLPTRRNRESQNAV